MIRKTYINKAGIKKVYEYDAKKYNVKRNKEICRLQRMKSYYKKRENFEKVEAIEMLINVAKRKAKIEKEE